MLAFLVTERMVDEPMFQLSLLGRREVWSVLVATALLAGTVFAAGTVTSSTRSTATLYAVQHGLLDTGDADS